MDPSLSLSTSCRILTICSSLNRAVSFVQQIRTLSGHSGDDDTEDEHASSGEEGVTSSSDEVIPWTISNKYYSAQVHFLARTVKGLAPFHLKDVPAVIFVWRKGDAYKHNIERICRDRDLNGSEPEVSLAVRIEFEQGDAQEKEREEVEDDEEEEEFEDSAEIDEFLSSKGFEFIDVPTGGRQKDEDEVLHDAIPSLPRVLDALSTIMWPSMQSSIKRQVRPQRGFLSQSSGTDALMEDDHDLDWAQNSFDQNDDLKLDIEDETGLVAAQTPAGRIVNETRRRKEMEELRRWLEEDDLDQDNAQSEKEENQENKDDPWRHVSSSTASHVGMMTMSPTSEEGRGLSSLSQQEDRFDDDFMVFVSAPAEESSGTTSTHFASPAPQAQSKSRTGVGNRIDFTEEGFPSFASFGDSEFVRATFDDDVGGDTSLDSLAPPGSYSGVMYHSLGSMSDLGEAHEAKDGDGESKEDENDEDDEGLPTRSEIRASAQRIFGPLSSSPSKGMLRKEEKGEEDEFDDDMDFEFTHMVSAIQGMKEEISGIEDEEERRKAAARVALGLVYGLDRQR